MRVYALCTGYIELDRASMVSDLKPGQPWTVPVTSFLVDHPRGRLLFDTGVHCQARLDPLARLGPERIKRLAVKSRAGDDVVPQLERLGLKPDDVRYVANSHLHFDHCGGNEFFPRATFLVQRPELEAARRPGFVPSYSPSPIDFDHPLDYRMLDGEHDVFGDGSVVLLPTYGHTPGHQSLLIRDGASRGSSARPTPATRARTWTATCCRTSSGTRRSCASRWPRCASSETRPAPPCSTATTPRSGRRPRRRRRP